MLDCSFAMQFCHQFVQPLSGVFTWFAYRFASCFFCRRQFEELITESRGGRYLKVYDPMKGEASGDLVPSSQSLKQHLSQTAHDHTQLNSLKVGLFVPLTCSIMGSWLTSILNLNPQDISGWDTEKSNSLLFIWLHLFMYWDFYRSGMKKLIDTSTHLIQSVVE